ncbi:MAG: GGDEF domain-containing protein [Oscillospiraceae bacterium]|nr:GGDEF domain-containing protein [Oscillospiraceae bacterium]
MKKLKFVIDKYFGYHLPIRQRFFNIIFICGFIVGLMGVLACISLKSSPEAITVAATMTIIMPLLGLLGITSKKKQDFILYLSLGVLNFLILPAMYLTGGGIDCGIPSYFTLGLALTLFLTKGTSGIILTVIEAIWYGLVYIISYRYPTILSVVPACETVEGTKTFTFNAISSNTLMVCFALGILSKIIFSMYRKEYNIVSNSIEEVKRNSLIDPLTNVYNRRHMYTYLEEQIKIAEENNSDLSLVIFDIDKFKNLNDTYGHLLGDEVLKALTRILKNSCREKEIVARYGGEEFILILPGSNHDDALKRANEIRECIEQSHLSPELPSDRPVTISGGISTFKSGLNDEQLVAVADENLYKAKETGRNRICG